MYDYILKNYNRCSNKKAVAFRGGRYYFSIPLLDALKERGVIIDSSYNSNRPKKFFQRGCFYWENGMLEIPISISKKTSNLSGTPQEFNFNSMNFKPRSNEISEFKEAKKAMRDFLIKYYKDYGTDSIVCLVMHSWSFCLTSHLDEYFDTPYPPYPEFFDYLLGELKKEFLFVTMRDVADAIERKESYVENYPKIGDGCDICGAKRSEIVSVFSPDAPQLTKNSLKKKNRFRDEVYAHSDVVCSNCRAQDRHRTLCKILEFHKFDFFNKNWLHISPSVCEKLLLAKFLPEKITTIDIRPTLNTDIVGDISNMPDVDSNQFEIVLACGVLNHVKNDIEALKEIYRVMKPGGKFLIWVQMLGSELIEVPDPEQWYGKDDLEKYNVGTFRYYGMANFHKMLKRHFDVEECIEKDIPSGIDNIWYICTKEKKDIVNSTAENPMNAN